MFEKHHSLRIKSEFWKKKQPFTLQIICLAKILQNKNLRKQVNKHSNIFKNRSFKNQWNHYKFGVFSISSAYFYPQLRFQTAFDIAEIHSSVQVFCYCRCNQYAFTHRSGDYPRFSFRYSHYNQKHIYIFEGNYNWRLKRNSISN